MRKYSLRPSLPDSFHSEFSHIPELTRSLLFHRGIDTKEKIDQFLNPSYDVHLHNPLSIKNMERVVDRVLKAISSGEKIVIYSDYDHDGIPGGVILHDFFKKIGYQNFLNYIPHRYTEGYGLNSRAVEKLAEDGAKLIITVDCGITDVEPVARGNELGLDIIITDHHLPAGNLPEAFAILNSKQEDDDYAFDMLCGAAVAWKLVQALIIKGDFDIEDGWEKWLLDLVGLSTIADMVPLHGENRILAHYGLKVLRKSSRPGLRTLFRATRLRQEYISEDDVGFTIAPRINAASRMDDPRLAFDLLTSPDYGLSDTLAKTLEKLNAERKGLVASMVKEMKHTLENRNVLSPLIVMGNPSWRPGLLGLAANSLVEAHRRPVFLWGREGGETLKGSCRSDGSVDLVSLMGAVPEDTFLEFGGHALSGGFSVSYDKVHYLEQTLSDAYAKVGTEEKVQEVLVDGELRIADIRDELYRQISSLSPFGVGNPKPLFLFRGASVLSAKSFGKKKEHLEISFNREPDAPLKAIQFFNTDNSLLALAPGERVDFVGHIEFSTFGRQKEIRIRIVEVLK